MDSIQTPEPAEFGDELSPNMKSTSEESAARSGGERKALLDISAPWVDAVRDGDAELMAKRVLAVLMKGNCAVLRRRFPGATRQEYEDIATTVATNLWAQFECLKDKLTCLDREAAVAAGKRLLGGFIRRRVCDHVRRSVAERRRFVPNDDAPDLPDMNDIESAYRRERLLQQLEKCIGKLPQSLQSIVHAWLQVGKQTAIVADVGISKSAASCRYQKARKQLRHCLESSDIGMENDGHERK